MTSKSDKVWSILSSLIPSSESGDYWFSLLKFVKVHKRLPSRGRNTFNDALFRIKTTKDITDPLRVFITDKEYFKIFVSSVAGPQYTVPTHAILRSREDVDQYDFPERFCAKPTHMSGKVSIVNDGSVDRDEYKSWFSLDHYAVSRERNYYSLQPKIIVEPIIFEQADITDFRVFCYKGKARLICLDVGKYSNYRRAFYSVDWIKLNFSLGYPGYEEDIDRPENLSEMLNVAEKLSKWLDFVRVDFYTNGEHFYLGEMTNCHASASQRFLPLEAEEVASSIIFGSDAN